MAEVCAKGGADDDNADESSALLKQRPGLVVPCEVEQTASHNDERLHTTALRRFWRGLVNAFSFGNAQYARRRFILILLGILTFGSGAYLAISIMTPSTPAPSIPGDIRLVLLADVHLIGPQYENGTESNDVDNESILKAESRLREAKRKIEALQPAPAAVVFLGDVVHNGYASRELKWYEDNRNAFTVGQEIFSSFKIPVRYIWGNHDYHIVCGNVSKSFDRFQLSHRLFQRFLGDDAKEYGILRAGRYKLLFLNGMLGPSWDPTHPRCDTRFASLGEQQLRWLAEQLRGTEPTFVFLHHPLPVTMRSEAPNLHHPDLLSLLVANSQHIMAVFSGHYHRGLFWQDAYPFRHYTLPSCRYDSDNWFVLHLPSTGDVRSWELLDWEKNTKRRNEYDLDGDGSRCSETWDYPGGTWGWQLPRRLEPQPPEDGSCGSPTTAEVDSGATLPNLQKADDVPGPTGHQFNPEPACSREYLPAFLDLCLKEGASTACCGILGQHLRPSSAAYAASCMCWPAFWQEAHRLFRKENRSATAVTELLAGCEADFGTTSLQWPGRPASDVTCDILLLPFRSGCGTSSSRKMASIIGTGPAASSAAIRNSWGKKSYSLLDSATFARVARVPVPSWVRCRHLTQPPPLIAPPSAVPYGSGGGPCGMDSGGVLAGGDEVANSILTEAAEGKVRGRHHAAAPSGCSSGGDGGGEVSAYTHIVSSTIGALSGILAVLAALGRGAAGTLSCTSGTAAITAGALGGAVLGELLLGRAGEEDVETDADVERSMEDAAERVVQKLRVAKAMGGLHRTHQRGRGIPLRN